MLLFCSDFCFFSSLLFLGSALCLSFLIRPFWSAFCLLVLLFSSAMCVSDSSFLLLDGVFWFWFLILLLDSALYFCFFLTLLSALYFLFLILLSDSESAFRFGFLLQLLDSAFWFFLASPSCFCFLVLRDSAVFPLFSEFEKIGSKRNTSPFRKHFCFPFSLVRNQNSISVFFFSKRAKTQHRTRGILWSHTNYINTG